MNILVIEDEMTVARRLIRFIREIRGENTDRIHHVLDLDDAEEYLAEQPVDLVTLDLNLNGSSGFDLLKRLVAGSFHTIVVSAHSEQAITAFEYGVLDFVAKPFRKQRLAQALARFSDNAKGAEFATRYTAVKTVAGIEVLLVSDVLYFKAEGNYAAVVMSSGKEYLHDKNLDKLEQLMPPSFMRTHRSYIVNMDKISSLHNYPGSRYEMTLQNEQILPISRHKIKKIKQLVNL